MARFHCSCRIIWFPSAPYPNGDYSDERRPTSKSGMIKDSLDTRVSQSEIDQSNLSPVPHSQFAICKSIDLPSATTSPDSKTGQAEY